jgi:hypothetical protein
VISHRTRIAALALLACLATLGPSAAAGASTPLDGNGMWIWYVNRSGGTAAKIAARAKAHNVKTVFIKSSDGKNEWSQFTRGLIEKLHHRGLDVCGWAFVYGDNPGPEAQRGAEVKKKGADCLIIDAETAYEGKYRAADHYMTALRQETGKKFALALAGFPYVDYHPSFPYSVFFRQGGAQFNMPQMYWKDIGTSVKDVFTHTYLWNSPYDKKIFPLGQTYNDPGEKQIRAFRKEAAARGASGVNWWSWQETSNAEFNAIGVKLENERPSRPKRYPVLARRAQGDVVVWLQELLKANGRKLSVDGDFGNQTRKALRAFQADKHLSITGTTDVRTWRRLLRRAPAITHWWHPGHGKAAGPSAPKSAGIETTRLEFTPRPR